MRSGTEPLLKNIRLAQIGALAAAVYLTACGGSHDANDTATSQAASSPAPAPTPAPPAAPTPTAPSPPPAPSAPSPAPTGQWVDVTSNLTGMASECGNVSGMHASRTEDLLITGVALRGLWGSTNGGASWSSLGAGAGSDAVINRVVSVLDDPDHPGTWWEAGIYNGNGVYKTTDRGTTVKQVGAIGSTDFISVDFKDPQRKTMLAGPHERTHMLFKSTDAGATWADIGAAATGLPDQHCQSPLIIDSQTYLLGCNGWASGAKGVFRSTDGGHAWTQVSAFGGNGAPLRASDNSIYWLSADGQGMARSTDDGVHWTLVGGANMNLGWAVEELPDGRIAAVSGSGIAVSADHGASWKAVAPQLPFTVFGMTYSKFRKAFYAFQFSCGPGSIPVPSNAINRFDFDYTKQ